jgi:branched-chain amino acid transport system substrate-binding protein
VSSSTTASSAASKSEVAVGVLGTYSGVQGSTYAGTTEVAQAWAQWVNARGGLNGHPVKLLVRDDAADPAKSLGMLQELVEKDKVIAIIGAHGDATASWGPYLKDKKVPIFSGLTTGAIWGTNPNAILIGSSTVAFGWGAVTAVKLAGAKKFGLTYCAENPACAQLTGFLKPLVAQAGMTFDFQRGTTATQPNYTAECLAAQQAGVDGLFLALSQSALAAFIKSCAEQSYHPNWGVAASGDPASLVNTPGIETATIMAGDFPGFLDDPATADYRAAVAKYVHGKSPVELSSAGAGTWATGMLLAAATKNLGDNPTANDVFEGLYGLKDETLGGLALKPLNFVRDQPFPLINCVYFFKVANKQLTAPDGLKARCQP